MANLIDQKHAVLLQLRELARRQMPLIEANNMSDLLSLLSAKQSLLSQLQRVEGQLDPFRHQDPERRQWRSPEDRQRCAQTAAATRGLLEEIMEIERRGESRLRENRDRTAQRLDRVHQAGEVQSAYLEIIAPTYGALARLGLGNVNSPWSIRHKTLPNSTR